MKPSAEQEALGKPSSALPLHGSSSRQEQVRPPSYSLLLSGLFGAVVLLGVMAEHINQEIPVQATVIGATAKQAPNERDAKLP